MATYTVGVFQNTEWARRGIDALLAAGFAVESLSVLAKSSPEAEALIQSALGRAPDRFEMKIKEPSSIVATGPLINTLQGRDSALATSNLAPLFRRAGFQAHDGQIYEALLGRGGVLVAILTEPRAADALAKLHAYGGGNAAIGAWTGRV